MAELVPPPDWTRITTIADAASEPLRGITNGLPPIPGQTILANLKERLSLREAAWHNWAGAR